MYAAAGGASLASRQARQRQRQQNKTKQLQARLHPAQKALNLEAAAGIPVRIQQPSRQFHQLPSSYLRTPQAQARKLSASYTAQSKLLLPIDEGDGQSVQLHHAHHHHDFHGRTSTPKLVHRHSGSGGVTFHHSHLTKSATATLPLVSQMEATPPTTPLIAINPTKPTDSGDRIQIQIPQDSIIVTPATPIASPGHIARETTVRSLDDDNITPPFNQLERKCSVYRMRRSDAFEQDNVDNVNVTNQFEPCTDETSLIFKGLPNGGSSAHKWQPCAYCEEGICVCEHIECAQGRAAWLERGRRCSVQDNNPTACHRRWVKRNRIQDASLGGSSDDEDFLGVLRGPSTFANAFLYVGLGTIALGLVIAFVGTGEKGFKTVELRLIGPSLIGLGLICCILRILFCICPSHCISSSKKARNKQGNKVDADHTTSLLRGETKRVSIARGPNAQKYPITHKKSNSKMLNEGMEALRQIATTSLFLQNEQKPSMNRIVPIIKEPEKPAEAHLEMKKLVNTLNVSEISDDEDNKDEEENCPKVTVPVNCTKEKPPLERSSSKLSRQRVPLNQQYQLQQQQQQQQDNQRPQTSSESRDLLMETSLMVINPSVSSSTGSATTRPPSTTATTTKLSLPSTPTLIPPSTSSSSLLPAVQSMSLHVQSQSTINSNFDLPPSTPHKYNRPLGTTSNSTAPPSPTPSTTATAAMALHQHQQQQNILPGQIVEGGNLRLPTSTTTAALALPEKNSCKESTTRTSTNLAMAAPSMSGNTLARVPPLMPSTAALNFEPELLLSPAKLGQ